MDDGSLFDVLDYDQNWVAAPGSKACWENLGPAYLLDAVRGLCFMHTHTPPLVHLDIKSANVLISRGVAKLADLGLTKALRSNETAVPMDTKGKPLCTMDYAVRMARRTHATPC